MEYPRYFISRDRQCQSCWINYWKLCNNKGRTAVVNKNGKIISYVHWSLADWENWKSIGIVTEIKKEELVLLI